MEVIERELVLAGHFDVSKFTVQDEDRTFTRDVIQKSDVVFVVPIDANGIVWLVSQFRAPLNRNCLEFPAGNIDEGETPEQAAVRELREEIGATPVQLAHMGNYATSQGVMDEVSHFFLALVNFDQEKAPDGAEEESMSIIGRPIKNLRTSDFDGAQSALAWELARQII